MNGNPVNGAKTAHNATQIKNNTQKVAHSNIINKLHMKSHKKWLE